MSSDEDVSPPPSPGGIDEVEEADEDTLRILVSTDNHLGYCERDPVRGLDSFAAFEEVLSLAKQKKCDMVLIAGDLFHENKPSRRTLHKTMEIIRRYCMGPDPVQFKILSDQATNFRNVHGTVNYEDEFYSVDLPVFSIHGNHDDPTRDGGTEMLAALDLLAVSNLVNYFGRQDEVDNVEVSPVLIQKGTTRVALYGMGSMRDERLNRMWQDKKVRFLRPENDPEDEDDEEEDEEEEQNSWFNIFALHQNRDLGRGAKNCVHESMIPEWMDLVVWGHEHECRIECDESLVGTFRITQPGSSVATSLTGGEAVRKHVGLLEVRGKAFRLQPIPLTQVRSFVIGEISLQDEEEEELLDPEDPKVDGKITKLLEEKVKVLVFQAREQFKELHDAARAAGNPSADQSARNLHQLKYKLEKPAEVLVRLRVDHTGFSTLNNQRFGAKFVGKIANPADILLFSRRKQESKKSSGGGKSRSKKRGGALDQPVEPDELEEMHVEDLVQENLESADKKLELLDEKRLGLALEDFVAKEQARAINEAMSDMLKKQQKKLISRGHASQAEEEDGDHSRKVTTATAVRELIQEETEIGRENNLKQEEEQEQMAETSSKRKRKKHAKPTDEYDLGNKENLSEDDYEVAPVAKKRATKSSAKTSKSRSRSGSSQRAPDKDEDDYEVAPVAKKRATKSSAKTSKSRSRSGSSQKVPDEDHASAVKSPRSSNRPRRAAAKSQANYNDGDNDSDDEAEESEAVISIPGDDDDDDMSDMEEEVRPNKRARAPASSRKKAPAKQAEPSFVETKRSTKTAASQGSSRKSAKRTVVYELSDSDDGDGGAIANSMGMSGGWGSVDTASMPSQSRRK